MKNGILLTCAILLIITIAPAAMPMMVAVGGAASLKQPAVAGALPMSLVTCDPFSFAPAANFPVGEQHPQLATVGDFNGDGKLDIVTASQSPELELAIPEVSVLFGDGAGSFGAATNFALGHSPLSMAVGEFNGDGWLDLAMTNEGYTV